MGTAQRAAGTLWWITHSHNNCCPGTALSNIKTLRDSSITRKKCCRSTIQLPAISNSVTARARPGWVAHTNQRLVVLKWSQIGHVLLPRSLEARNNKLYMIANKYDLNHHHKTVRTVSQARQQHMAVKQKGSCVGGHVTSSKQQVNMISIANFIWTSDIVWLGRIIF